jgi:hypothetical protein
VVAERVDLGIGQGAGNEVEGEIEVGQGEKGEGQRDELIQEFDMQQDLPSDGMVGMPDLSEVDQRVDGSEEGTVQPASPLRDELGNGIYLKVST